MKAYLRGQIISYSSRKNKAQQGNIKRLTDDIFNLDQTIAITPSQDLL